MIRKILLCVIMLCLSACGEKKKLEHDLKKSRDWVKVIEFPAVWTQEFTIDKSLIWIYKGKEYNFKELIKAVNKEIEKDEKNYVHFKYDNYSNDDPIGTNKPIYSANKIKKLKCILHWKNENSNEWEVTIGKEKVIKELAKSGAICEVFGHQWEYDRKIGIIKTDSFYQYYRECKICGRREYKKETWEVE